MRLSLENLAHHETRGWYHMSTFYGTLQGCRGEATRCGSRASGIKASAQSWDGSIITELSYTDDDELLVRICVTDGSSSYMSGATWRGTIDELREALQRDMQRR